MDSKRNQEDRLSSLPDPLLVHILSFLPTTEAVKTMLIKPFGNLWTSLPNLSLHSSFFCWHDNGGNGPSTMDLQMFRFARNLLMRHRNPKIDKFNVTIDQTSDYEIDYRNIRAEIDSWINFALGKQVEVLEFCVVFPFPDDDPYILPHSMFISDSLVHLKLDWVEMYFQRRVQMRSLETLRLISVNISDQVFREIISGCPFLMELEIDSCWGFNELNIEAPNFETLKLDMGDCEDRFLRINCPTLRSFDFTGFARFVEVINLSSLVDLTLHFDMMDFQESPQFIAVLEKVVHAKVVSLSNLSTTALLYCLLKDIPHLMFDWKCLTLSFCSTDWHIFALDHLLNNSTCLEKLAIHLERWFPTFAEPIESKLNSYIPDEEGGWRCLKSIAIHGISKSLYDVLLRLVELLLKKALVLDELVIYYRKRSLKFTSEELKRFSKRLSTFSKASQHAKVLLLRKSKETPSTDF